MKQSWKIEMSLSTFFGSYTTNNISSIVKCTFGMEGSLFSSETLHQDLKVHYSEVTIYTILALELYFEH